MFTSEEQILAYIRDEDVEYVDIRFCDLPGVMQHFSIPASAFTSEVFTDGLAFDGSSIRGFQSIHESDMQLFPDITTATVGQCRAPQRLRTSCLVHDPVTREPYRRHPRDTARKAEDYLRSPVIADTGFFGAEAECYIFESVRFDSQPHGSFYGV